MTPVIELFRIADNWYNASKYQAVIDLLPDDLLEKNKHDPLTAAIRNSQIR